MRGGVIIALLALLLTNTQGCVESACFVHSDCPDDQVCYSDGKCRKPECTSHDQCGDRQVCESYACVEGCVDESDCDGGQVCSFNRCVAENQQCDCPSAPGFCVKDVNPKSAAVGTDVCLDHFGGNAVVLLFGSIACPHCHGLFKRLETIKETLKAEGLSPVLLFVNLKSVVLDGPTVEALMGFATEPLLQDTAEEDIWGDFGADWYEVVLIDRNGCLVQHVGPLSENDLIDQPGALFAEKWRQAAAAECAAGTGDVVAEGDLHSDVVPGDALDLLDTLVPPPDASDLTTDVPDGVPFDEGMTDSDSSDSASVDGVDLSPDQSVEDVVFELHDVCQIAPVSPIAVGQSVPHFLCMDRNFLSASTGQAVSDITLKTLVWIAYTGACT